MNKNKLKDFLSGSDYFYLHRDQYRTGIIRKRHSHDFSEIFCIESGEGSHELNGKYFKLKAGMLIYLNPADIHKLIYKKGMKIINIAFPSGSAELFNSYGMIPAPKKEDRLLHILNTTELETFARWCEQLSRNSHSRLELDRFLLNLLSLISGTLPAAKQHEEKTQAGVKQITDWLNDFDKHRDDPLLISRNVTDISRQFGISREHFSREIKKKYGMNAIQLINAGRMRYAEQQLKMTNKPVSEISDACGYSSPGQFYQIFKRTTGTTPKKYREHTP